MNKEEDICWRTQQLCTRATLMLLGYTVQVRDKRPTHTQNARTIFAQTRVEKRVPKHALCCILLHNKRER